MKHRPGVNRSRVVILVVAIVCTAGGVHAARPVLQSDFEEPSPSNPPAGWTMWGSQKYKTPSNYTRDTRYPHGGNACFRIHHPAGTEGYVVSSPETAIRPTPGMMYTVTFWRAATGPAKRSSAGTPITSYDRL